MMENKHILVLFDSMQGATLALARQICLGIDEWAIKQQLPITSMLRSVPKVSPENQASQPFIATEGVPYVSLDEFKNCIGLALGSPTYFGNMSSHLKYFLEQTSGAWIQGEMIGKPACVFTSTGSLHGGQESTLLSMMLPLMHHGMIILSLPYVNTGLMHTKTGGSPYGLSHHAHKNCDPKAPLSTEEINMAKYMGQYLAQNAHKLSI